MNYIAEDEAYFRFNEMLDEIHDEIVIGSVQFAPSRVLFELDRVAYDQAFFDFLDANDLTTEWTESDEYAEEE